MLQCVPSCCNALLNAFIFYLHPQRGHELTVRQEENIAEHIDEEVHMLQYKLDHVRRYILNLTYCVFVRTYRALTCP